MNGRFRSILLAGTVAIAAMTALPGAAHALDVPPRTSYFDRLNDAQSMAARVRAAYVRQGEALARCDAQAAQAALDELERLVREARAAAQAARAAGNLSAINPDDAEEDHQVALGHRHFARARQAAGCPPPAPPPAQRHPLVGEVATLLERARAAAASCNRAELEAIIREIEDLHLEAVTDYDRGITWRDLNAIDEMLEDAKGLRGRCGDAPPPPPPPPPPPQPQQQEQQQLSPSDEAALGTQTNTIAGIERLIAEAEAARLRGDCANFRSLIDQAKRDLDRTSYLMVPVDTHGQLTRRIDEVRGRLCVRPPGPVDPGPSLPAQPPRIDLPAGYGVSDKLTIGVEASMMISRLPQANYGFLRLSSSADEETAGRSARHLTVYGVDLTALLPDLGLFAVTYSGGSRRTSFEVGVLGNGGASGIINTAEAPSGSTGVTADFGVTGTTRTSTDDFGFGYRRNFKSSPVRETPGDMTSFQLFLGLESHFGRRRHDASLRMSGTTGGGFQFEVNQLLDQRVDSLRLGGSVGAAVQIPLAPKVALELGGEAGLHYYNFDLRSIETRTQNIGPTSDHNFENRIEDDRSGVGWRGALWGGIAFGLSDRVSIGLTGGIDYLSHAAHVVNPPSGDALLAGQTTGLETDDMFGWRISMALRMELAARGRIGR